jgi:hypothetical protein
VDTFLNDVVAPTKAFVPNSDPVSVSGGWVSPIAFKSHRPVHALILEIIPRKLTHPIDPIVVRFGGGGRRSSAARMYANPATS